MLTRFTRRYHGYNFCYIFLPLLICLSSGRSPALQRLLDVFGALFGFLSACSPRGLQSSAHRTKMHQFHSSHGHFMLFIYIKKHFHLRSKSKLFEKSLMNSFMLLHSATHDRCSIDRKYAFGNLKSHWDLQVVTFGALSCDLHRYSIRQQVVAEHNLEMPDTSDISHRGKRSIAFQ